MIYAHAATEKSNVADRADRVIRMATYGMSNVTIEGHPSPVPATTERHQPASLVEFVDPAHWQGRAIPTRAWFVPDLIPARTVTMLSGDGGLGKSLIGLQLGMASALGCATMGLTPAAGRVLYVGAEDEQDEFHRRIDGILAACQRDYSDLAGRFLLMPLAERDAVLAAPDRAGKMTPTELMAALVEKVARFRPGLIVLDTSADLFGGDEIKRSQVRQFVAMLRAVAISIDCAVLLLSHPSVTGMMTGSGTSGSTAWSNSVRSRLYLTAPTGEDTDPDARVLTTMKSNYGRAGDTLKLRWQDGVFVRDDGRPALHVGLTNTMADRVYLSLLSKLTRQGQKMSPNPSPSFAPKVMAAHPDAEGLSKKQLAAAQQRLLDGDKIRIVEEGPASRRYKRLIVTEEIFGEGSN